MTAPRHAVLFRTHVWDDFVERQYRRLEAVVGTGDLFILLDESNGPVETGRSNVVSHTDASIRALGLAPGGTGNMLWYNGDYPLYLFFERHPDYAYYAMVEYDVCVRTPLDALVARAAETQVGLVSLTKGEPVSAWAHAESCADVYGADEVQKRLICFALFSREAVRALFDRRRALSRALEAGAISRWPFCEAFIPTELAARGFTLRELSAFGSTRHYDWWPPVLEDDLEALAGETFVHPVLDPARYVESALRIWRISDLLDRGSDLRQRLRKVPLGLAGPRLAGALRRRAGRAVRRRLPWAA